jgi:hypothetical protein
MLQPSCGQNSERIKEKIENEWDTSCCCQSSFKSLAFGLTAAINEKAPKSGLFCGEAYFKPRWVAWFPVPAPTHHFHTFPS